MKMNENPVQNAARVIRDSSRMKQRADHLFLNFLYVLLVIAGSGCALWQHGDVYLTSAVMGLAPLMYLILLIPYRIYPVLWRQVFNGLFFSGVVLWGIYRMRSALPDLVLVECLSASSLVFLAGGEEKDRGYLFFISLFLMVYGALIPRMAYLYFALAALAVLGIILLIRRSDLLAGGKCFREKKIRFVPRIIPVILLLIISGVLFRYIFALFPLEDNDVPGYFQTSFLTTRENALPVELQKWFSFRKPEAVKEARKEDLNTRFSARIKSAAPPVQTKDPQGKPVNLPESKEKSLIEGNGGSAPPGGDLLYYVKSPVLLYHLVRLYDSYDGNTWKESIRFQKMRLRNQSMKSSAILEQNYTVMKWSSNQLPGGFMPLEFYVPTSVSPSVMRLRIQRRNPYGAYLKKIPEQLPFQYTVSVYCNEKTLVGRLEQVLAEFRQNHEEEIGKRADGTFPVPSEKNLINHSLNLENLPLNHYIKLPRKAISRRVRDLARKITENCTSDEEKAFALRDYLRKNYSYSLESSNKVPPGKEGSDYFLFELKKGHCEYFACTLAVLARCAGLPARVATGYSPGNYNTLTKVFEVYEYHAHAWTQIFLREKGWVTMDATPPSALDSEILPRGLGRLRDPFGEEWKISAPELAKSNRQAMENRYMTYLQKKLRDAPVIDRALLQMVKTQEKVETQVREKYNVTMKKVEQSRTNRNGKLYKLRQFFRKSMDWCVGLFYAGCDFIYSAWLILLTGGLLLTVLYKFGKMIFYESYRKRIFKKIRHLEQEAESCVRTDPRKAVLCYYRAYRLVLFCTGRDRKENQELLDLSDELGRYSMVLGESSRWIFLLFYKAEYGAAAVTVREAESAGKYYASGRDKLFELFYEGAEKESAK